MGKLFESGDSVIGLLCINPSLGGNSDYYGTFINIANGFTGNIFKGLNVVQNSSPNLTALVNPGSGIIREGTFPGDIAYHVACDTSSGASVSLAGLPDPSNPRNCYIIAYVDKATTPSGTNNTNVFKLVAVGGTPSGTPADPTTAQIQASTVGATKPYYVLGRVRLGTGATLISTAMIDDLRVMTLPSNIGATWTAYTPTVTAGSGSFTTASGSIRYEQIGKSVKIHIEATVTTVGTGTGSVVATLPVAAKAGRNYILAGREDGVSGKMLQGKVSGSTIVIFNYDNTAPIAAGVVCKLDGTYEAA